MRRTPPRQIILQPVRGRPAPATYVDSRLPALGDVPNFVAVADPPLWTDKGARVAQLDRPRPIFIRAALYPMDKPVSMHPAPRFPGWYIYGGPMAESQYEQAFNNLQQWAWHARSADGSVQGYFVAGQKVPIAPDGFHNRWPRNSFGWQWVYETAPPRMWRWEQSVIGSGDPGRWVAVA